jgi:aminomethyltransferase
LDETDIGVITSGTFSPLLELGIGMGFSSAALENGQKFRIGDGRSTFEAVITEKPFVKKTSLKN